MLAKTQLKRKRTAATGKVGKVPVRSSAKEKKPVFRAIVAPATALDPVVAPGSPKKFRARVRMYWHGLGDCFLITFPRAGKDPFQILIDCGALARDKESMTRIVEPKRQSQRQSASRRGGGESLFSVEWFDSKTERTVANMVDANEEVTCWIRLHIGELPILWNSAGRKYNPDFIVTEIGGTYWVVEVKMEKEMTSEDIKEKRDAARRWANYVTADASVGVTWRYLLVSEADVDTAKGSWGALKKLGGE
jgi:hypothetical protein